MPLKRFLRSFGEIILPQARKTILKAIKRRIFSKFNLLKFIYIIYFIFIIIIIILIKVIKEQRRHILNFKATYTELIFPQRRHILNFKATYTELYFPKQTKRRHIDKCVALLL